MQTEIDMDVLMGVIQSAAVRRGLFVAYTPMHGKWTVINPAGGGAMVGSNARLEKIFDVLDEFPITIEGKLLAAAMENEESST